MPASLPAKSPENGLSDDSFYVGPPPAAPPMCFRCVTGTCGHRDLLGDAHGGGMVPALTYFQGTPLCLDCATKITKGGQ